MMLSDVCLSDVCRVHRALVEDRPRNTKIGTEVDHVTFDSDTTFKVKKSKVEVTSPFCSPPCWRVRQLQQWAWERVGSGKLLLACYVAICSATQGASMPTGGEGRGHIVAATRLQLVVFDSVILSRAT